MQSYICRPAQTFPTIQLFYLIYSRSQKLKTHNTLVIAGSIGKTAKCSFGCFNGRRHYLWEVTVVLFTIAKPLKKAPDQLTFSCCSARKLNFEFISQFPYSQNIEFYEEIELGSENFTRWLEWIYFHLQITVQKHLCYSEYRQNEIDVYLMRSWGNVATRTPKNWRLHFGDTFCILHTSKGFKWVQMEELLGALLTWDLTFEETTSNGVSPLNPHCVHPDKCLYRPV